VARADGDVERITAILENGRWRAATALTDGDVATIEPGDLVDVNGEINGERMPLVA
jgi:hypothetical protein